MLYLTKLQERTTQAWRNDHTKTAAQKMFRPEYNTLRAWERLEVKTGLLKNRPLARVTYKIDREKLPKWRHENSHSTNKGAAAAFRCGLSGIRRAKKLLVITPPKAPPTLKKL